MCIYSKYGKWNFEQVFKKGKRLGIFGYERESLQIENCYLIICGGKLLMAKILGSVVNYSGLHAMGFKDGVK